MICKTVCALAIGLTLAQGEQYTGACDDRLTVEDRAPGIVVVRFQNGSYCTFRESPDVFTTARGVQVKVRISINPVQGRQDDRLIVTPLTEGYKATPPEIDIPEGETGEILVMVGMS